ncbi:MAG: MarR family winged helix-turn-helix transcriptional regulator [Omnitrophica WOR_2 bacterium]
MEEYLQKSNPQSITTGPLKEGLLTEMRLTVRAMMSAIQHYTGITPMRLLIFQLLESGKELSQAEIQRQLGVDGALITRLVKQMEADGFLTRRPDPADNRYTLVRLTEKAQKMIAEMMFRRRSIEPLLLEGLSDEAITGMRQVMQRIRQNIEGLPAPHREDQSHPSEGDPLV